MNTDKIIEAARLYLGVEATANSFNGLLLQVAHKYLGSTSRMSLNGAGLDALNAYLTVDRVALADAMNDAAVQYLAGDDDGGNPVDAAVAKYIATGGIPPGPINTVAPVVSGTPNVGQTLTTTNGTWTGTGTITYTYQWVNSASGDIAGATLSTYALQASDEGDNITARVTATDNNGSASAVSNSLGPIAAAGKTYAEFQAHIAALATSGFKEWTSAGDTWFITPGNYRSAAAAAGSVMFGSPWQSQMSDQTGSVCRMYQHALPSQVVFDAQIASGLEFYFEIIVPVSGPLVALDRNGYLSMGAGGLNTSVECRRYIRWDAALGKAFEGNPFAGTAETPYDWVIPVAKTYTEFQTHIATLATGGVKPWSGVGAQPLGAPGAFRTTAAAAAGDMFGSSWLSQLSDQTWSPCRTIQHGLPSEAAFNAQVAGAFEVFFKLAATASGPHVALARNGFTSNADGGGANTRVVCDDLIYWDGTQAQRMNPSTGTGPTPYTWTP